MNRLKTMLIERPLRLIGFCVIAGMLLWVIRNLLPLRGRFGLGELFVLAIGPAVICAVLWFPVTLIHVLREIRDRLG